MYIKSSHSAFVQCLENDYQWACTLHMQATRCISSHLLFFIRLSVSLSIQFFMFEMKRKCSIFVEPSRIHIVHWHVHAHSTFEQKKNCVKLRWKKEWRKKNDHIRNMLAFVDLIVGLKQIQMQDTIQQQLEYGMNKIIRKFNNHFTKYKT